MSRYHRIEHNPQAIEQLFLEIFLESHSLPPRQIILDMDVTDDQVHGNQEGAFFNTYYNGVCCAPLYIFCGHQLQHILFAVSSPRLIEKVRDLLVAWGHDA